jgi:hypothetical protein
MKRPVIEFKTPRPEPQPYRRCGNTTRLADWYVQCFFETGTTGKIIDHESNADSDFNLQKRVYDRLVSFHGIDIRHISKHTKTEIRLTDEAFIEIYRSKIHL